MTGLLLLTALLTAFTPRAAAAMPADYTNIDQAAVAFIDLVRANPEQRKEYCAWLIKKPNGRIRIGDIAENGTMNHCPTQWPKPAGAQASVHTHPIWGEGASDPTAEGQMFSDGDFAHSEAAVANVPVYLGAPAGHILRYDPGGTTCWGRSFIARKFRIVRDLNPSVRAHLPLKSGERTPLFDIAGRPIPKPSYCKDAPR